MRDLASLGDFPHSPQTCRSAASPWPPQEKDAVWNCFLQEFTRKATSGVEMQEL